MTGPTLQRATALSLAMHLTLVALIFMMARNRADFVMPAPYVVSLVTPQAARTPERPPAPAPSEPEAEKAAPPRVEKGVSAVAPETSKTTGKAPSKPAEKPLEREKFKDYKSERLKELKAKAEREQYLADRLGAIESKQKLRRIAEIKRSITLKAGGPQSPSAGAPPTTAEPSMFDEYFLHVHDKIWQNWVFPGPGARGLVAVVSITVMRDGRARINGFEKSSGNPVFDQSVLRAIGKASPFDRPPFEMEIGVRFSPDEE
jgi:colicin import membrane protein